MSYSDSTYHGIDALEELIDMHEDSSWENLESIVKLLDVCKISLENVFTHHYVNLETEAYTLRLVENCLEIMCPRWFLNADELNRIAGHALHEKINYMKNLIKSQNLQDYSFETLIEDIESYEDSTYPLQIEYKLLVSNIMHRLDELTVLAKRMFGDPNENFEISENSPFVNTGYMRLYEESGKFLVVKEFYKNAKINELSKLYKTLSRKLSKPTKSDQNNRSRMEKCIIKARTRLLEHKKNFNEDRFWFHFDGMSQMWYVAYYLLQLANLINVKHFDVEKEMEKQILENIDGFSFIIHSMPFREIVDMFTKCNGWDAIRNIIYATDKILENEPNSADLVEKLKKLKIVSCQLFNICMIEELREIAMSSEIVHEKNIPFISTERILPNIIPEDLSDDWKIKFELEKSEKEVLDNCPHDQCYVCREKYADILANSPESNGNLAVLVKCQHLTCVPCIEKCILVKNSR